MEITQTQEKEIRIFKTVLAHTAEIVTFDRFYVALYDRRKASIYFPLVQLEDGACLTLGEINDGLWAAHPYAPEEQWPDCLLRPDAPLPNGSDLQTWLTTHGISYQPTPQPLSSMIAPLKARGAMMGVLITENLQPDQAYDEDLQKWFATVASRAAGTLSRLRLVESLRTVNRVGQRLTAEAHQDIDKVLNLIHQQASLLLDTRDMYITLYDPGLQELSFPLAYYDGVHENWPARKLLDAGVTEEVIRTRKPLRLDNYRRWYAERSVDPPVLPEESPKSWLGVPMSSGDRVLGIIALQNDEVEGLYSEDDQDILQTMANQAAVAIANARLVERLRAVNEVGQRLTSGVRLREGEILNLIYEQAGLLMDTRDMYIAFYNAEKQELSFPLAYYDGKRETDWPSRTANIDDLTRGGLTEEVLRTKALVCPSNVEDWYQSRNITPAVRPLPKSWLGVPLMVEDRILGVIALQNDEIENLYGPDDVEVLQTMAGQVAVALENARLVAGLKKAQDVIAERERDLVMTSMAMDFVHKMNNLAGPIGPWVGLVRDELMSMEQQNTKVTHYLDNIYNGAALMLKEAQEFRYPSTQPEQIKLEELVESIVGQVELMTSAIIEFDSEPELPLICAVEYQIAAAIYSLIDNAIKAVADQGNISINLKRDNTKEGFIALEVSDTGCGIPSDKLKTIFDLGISYWAGHQGTGYGLWRAQNIARSIGGSISATSMLGKGSTFTVLLPFT